MDGLLPDLTPGNLVDELLKLKPCVPFLCRSELATHPDTLAAIRDAAQPAQPAPPAVGIVVHPYYCESGDEEARRQAEDARQDFMDAAMQEYVRWLLLAQRDAP